MNNPNENFPILYFPYIDMIASQNPRKLWYYQANKCKIHPISAYFYHQAWVIHQQEFNIQFPAEYQLVEQTEQQNSNFQAYGGHR